VATEQPVSLQHIFTTRISDRLAYLRSVSFTTVLSHIKLMYDVLRYVVGENIQHQNCVISLRAGELIKL